MKISSITLTYNELELTKKHLQSLIDNTPLITELIIVDAPHAPYDPTPDSNEETRRWLNRFVMGKLNYKLVELDKPWWWEPALNRGIEICEENAKYIVMLNNDVFFRAGWLEPIIKLMEKDKKIGWMSPYQCDTGFFPHDMGRNSYGERIFFEPETMNPNIPIPVVFANGACMVFRKKALYDVGLWDEKQNEYCEFNMGITMWKKGWKVMVHPKSAVIHLGRFTKKKHETWEPKRWTWKQIFEWHNVEYMDGEKYFWSKHTEEEVERIKNKVLSEQRKLNVEAIMV